MPSLYRTRAGGATLTALILAGAALGLPAVSRAHSHAALDARFEVNGAQLNATLRLGLRDLRHMLPIDRDGDGGMSPAEIEAASAPLGPYLAHALKLELAPGGEPCHLELDDLQLVDLGSVDAHLRFTCPRPSRAYTLSAGLFGGAGHTFDLRARFVDGAIERRVALSSRHNRVEVSLAPEEQPTPWLVVAGAIGLTAIVAALGVWILGRRRARRGRTETKTT